MRLGAIRRDTRSLNCCLYDEGVRVRTASFKASALGSVCLTLQCNAQTAEAPKLCLCCGLCFYTVYIL